jgi:cobalt/nickel transport system permease protein
MFMEVLALHIPDGFLTPGICLLGWVLAIVVLHLAIRHSREQFAERQVPFMGIMAAFVFAAQAINFPVVGGTSGHILGGALTGILIGPWAGTLVMTAVIIVQGLLFQDGGLLSMGWNILNMGAGSVLTGYATYYLMLRLVGEGTKLAPLVGFVAAWISVETGAVATALQLAASGTFPLHLSLPALTGIYGLIGIAEGIVTVAALGFIRSSYPALLRGKTAPGRISAVFVTFCLAGALVLALVSPIASPDPDGLEHAAEAGGFRRLSTESLFEIFPDYTVSLLENPSYSTMVAMIIGTLTVFGVVVALGQFIAMRARK